MQGTERICITSPNRFTMWVGYARRCTSSAKVLTQAEASAEQGTPGSPTDTIIILLSIYNLQSKIYN